jgi:16S rRNA (guanine527-N7)-methyltransferase
LTPDTIAKLLQPYINQPSERVEVAPDWPQIHAQLAIYLELILKWNMRTNLTSIRTPEEIVRRHFGESLFVGTHLGPCATLLDFGSGAGFPGIPIQLLRPDVQVTLAESQGKKAAFLREAVRSLGLPTEVWAGRVESMPPERQFDTVTLRAVDNMDAAVQSALLRARNRVMILGTSRAFPSLSGDFSIAEPIPLPGSNEGILLIASRR